MTLMNPRDYLIYSDSDLTHQVWRLIAARFLLYLGAMSSYFIGVMGTLTFAMGAGVGDNAIAVALINIFQMLGGIKGGELLDRLGPRWHVRFCAAVMVACGVLYQVLGTQVAGVFIGGGLFGFAWGCTDVVRRAYPAYFTDDVDALKRINSVVALMDNVAIVVGPIIGGLISLVAPTQTVFLFMAACSALALVPAWGIRALREPAREELAEDACAGEGEGCAEGAQSGKSGSVSAGFAEIFGSEVLSLLFWGSLLSFMAYGALDPLESLFYRDVLKVGAEWMGWLSALAGVGGIVGSLLAGALPARFINIRVLLMALALSGVGAFIYVCTPYVGVACVGQLICGMAFSAFGPIKDTLVQEHASLDRIGRVNAAMGAGYNAAGAIPLLCAPVLASIFGVQGTLIGVGVIVALIPTAIMVLRRRDLDAMVDEERRA